MIIKNSNLRRELFSSRYKILGGIIAIVLIFLITRLLNIQAKKQHEEEGKILQNKVVQSNVYKPEETTISGGNVEEKTQKENEQVIESFINYCNLGQIEQAYNLLTEECKEVVFSNSINNFKKIYVDKVFETQKKYYIQSWLTENTNYTYKVTIQSDLLSTGKVSSNQKIEDYYTVVQKNNTQKLNINSYIGKKIINKETSQNDITIKIESKDIFYENEIYNFEIINESNKNILLDSARNTGTVYLESDNEGRYNGFIYEIAPTELVIENNKNKKIQLKFNKRYSTDVRITKLVFEDIIKDYDEYIQLQNKEEYKDIIKLTINI